MAELIAPATAEVTSSEFTLVTPEIASLSLKDAITPDGGTFPPNGFAYVQYKAGTQFVTIGTLSSADPFKVLAAPGTFRVLKPKTPYALGVDKG